MILAVDVHYERNHAVTGGALFRRWDDAFPDIEIVSELDEINQYEPGEFYKRELPCILKLLKDHSLNPEYIIIDGYVYLDGHSSPGLGKYLFDALEGNIPVIGVAKSHYKNIPQDYGLLRGKSKKPLFITAVGTSLSQAKRFLLKMHGENRIPTLLKHVDTLCRDIHYRRLNSGGITHDR